MTICVAVVAFMAEDEAEKLAEQAAEMKVIAAALDARNIAGVQTGFGDDGGKSPTVEIELVACGPVQRAQSCSS
jgi:hypothetical protein